MKSIALDFPKLATAFLIASLFQISCSRPKVTIDVEDQEIRNVKNWSVAWSGDVEPDHDTLTTTEKLVLESRYYANEECRAYVEEVSQILRTTYAFNFYENMPVGGLAVIRLKGSIYPEYRARQMEGGWSGTSTGQTDYGLPDPYKTPPTATRSRSDRVKQVHVQIRDVTGDVLATITLTGNDRASVEPKHVASAIKKAIENED